MKGSECMSSSGLFSLVLLFSFYFLMAFGVGGEFSSINPNIQKEVTDWNYVVAPFHSRN